MGSCPDTDIDPEFQLVRGNCWRVPDFTIDRSYSSSQ